MVCDSQTLNLKQPFSDRFSSSLKFIELTNFVQLSWYFSWFSGSMRDIGFLGVEHWRLMFSTPENPFFRSQSKKKLERNFNEVQMKKKYRIHNIYVKECFKKPFSKNLSDSGVGDIVMLVTL